MLAHREDIRRTVKLVDDGVETLTESDDKAVVAMIQEHVGAMSWRVEQGRGIRHRDPLFAELFRHADMITMRVEQTPNGVRVKESSSDSYVVSLIQEHARVVSLFVKHGHAEARKNHPIPGAAETETAGLERSSAGCCQSEAEGDGANGCCRKDKAAGDAGCCKNGAEGKEYGGADSPCCKEGKRATK